VLFQVFQTQGLYQGFAICLTDNGGTFEVGVDYSSNSAFQWTPILQDLYYVVNMTELQVAGQSIGLGWSAFDKDNCIVDSGTTLLLFEKVVFQAVVTSFKNLCSTSNLVGICDQPSGKTMFDGYCFQLSPEQINAYPTLTFSFAQIPQLNLSPSSYLYASNGTYCMGIQNSGGDGTILGDIFMIGFHVAFDVQKNMVGFADVSTCPQVFESKTIITH